MNSHDSTVLDAVIIGAGFAGMYAIHKLREQGYAIRAVEAGNGVGGTWYWNRYPGARCDVESLEYSYTFDQGVIENWRWSERYATQPEILAYADYVADRLDLHRSITFGSRVTSAAFEEQSSTWQLTTDKGERIHARFLIGAVGALSTTTKSPFPGLEHFKGTVLHTGQWPHHPIDLRGQRIGVIGTGSSGIQVIPPLADVAQSLTVFQRTPNYTIPARNRPLYDDEVHRAHRFNRDITARARAHNVGLDWLEHKRDTLTTDGLSRAHDLELAWKLGGNIFMSTFNDIMMNLDANAVVSEFVRGKVRDIVENADTARKLTPTDYPLGGKRICVDTNYYETFNLPHVHLVDLREETVERFVAQGIKTSQRTVELDTVVLATGFDAMTGPLLSMNITGRNGVRLAECWSTGPRAYLGLATAEFPNFFMLTGPGSPSVLANMIAAIEQHVEWVADCMNHMRDNNLQTIESTVSSDAQWQAHVDDVAQYTVYVHARSWYRGMNIAGKTTGFLAYVGGLKNYRDKCDAVAGSGYEGFVLR